MAKAKNIVPLEGTASATASAAQTVPDNRPHYSVTLACPTPLAYSQLIVAADNAEGAKATFCEVNGISGSDHPFTVAPTDQPVTELPS